MSLMLVTPTKIRGYSELKVERPSLSLLQQNLAEFLSDQFKSTYIDKSCDGNVRRLIKSLSETQKCPEERPEWADEVLSLARVFAVVPQADRGKRRETIYERSVFFPKTCLAQAVANEERIWFYHVALELGGRIFDYDDPGFYGPGMDVWAETLFGEQRKKADVFVMSASLIAIQPDILLPTLNCYRKMAEKLPFMQFERNVTKKYGRNLEPVSFSSPAQDYHTFWGSSPAGS
jgi:hypothetical protein